MSSEGEQRIENAWKGYERVCVPADAGEMQRSESRQAFYAGAAVYHAMVIALSTDAVSEDKGTATLEALDAELSEFGAGLDRRYF